MRDAYAVIEKRAKASNFKFTILNILTSAVEEKQRLMTASFFVMCVTLQSQGLREI